MTVLPSQATIGPVMYHSGFPYLFDPYAAAKQKRQFSGTYALERFSRLPEVVVFQSPLHLTFRCKETEAGHPLIEGNFHAAVAMPCQRCLESITVAVTSEWRFIVEKENGTPCRYSTGYESLLLTETEQLDLLKALEDEVLLSFPFAPRHESECRGLIINGVSFDVSEGVMHRPFSVLNTVVLKKITKQ